MKMKEDDWIWYKNKKDNSWKKKIEHDIRGNEDNLLKKGLVWFA